MEASPAQRAALDKITAELAAAAGPALPGTLTIRAYPCGIVTVTPQAFTVTSPPGEY